MELLDQIDLVGLRRDDLRREMESPVNGALDVPLGIRAIMTRAVAKVNSCV